MLSSTEQALVDPNKRRMFDTLGSKGMQYVINPRSLSFQEVMSNFASASFWKRTKLAMVISVIFFFFLLQPILVCINIDKTTVYFGSFAANPYWPWTTVLTPLWIFDAIVLVWLGSQFFVNNSDEDGDEVHEEEEADRTQRPHKNCVTCTREVIQRSSYLIFRICRHLLLVLAEIFLALKLDGVFNFKYSIVFIPLYLHQFLYLAQLIRINLRARSDINRMVTVSYLERVILKRPYADLSGDEKRVISEAFIIVHSPVPDPDDEEEGHERIGTTNSIEDSEEFRLSQDIALESQKKLLFFPFRAIFVGLLIPQLDNKTINWNWWLVFLPLWIVIFCSCCSIIVDVAKSTAEAVYIVKVAKNDTENLPGESTEKTPDGALTVEANKEDHFDSNPPMMAAHEYRLDEENFISQIEREEVEQQIPKISSGEKMRFDSSLGDVQQDVVDPHLMAAQKCAPSEDNTESQIENDKGGKGIPVMTAQQYELDEEHVDRQNVPLKLTEAHKYELVEGSQVEKEDLGKVTPLKSSEVTQRPVSDIDEAVPQGVIDPAVDSEILNKSETLRTAEYAQKLDTSSSIESNFSPIQNSATNPLNEDLGGGQQIPESLTPDLEEGQVSPPDAQIGIEDDNDDSYEYFLLNDENVSRDASRLAVERCCWLIWVVVMSCLFVGKLQGAGYSALWIIFPILLPVSQF